MVFPFQHEDVTVREQANVGKVLSFVQSFQKGATPSSR